MLNRRGLALVMTLVLSGVCSLGVLNLLNAPSAAATPLPAGQQVTPHLGYGVNLRRNFDRIEQLGFEWVKLYEDEFVSPADFPITATQYHVLYRVKAEGWPGSIENYLAHIEQLVTAGLGKVAAYEIGNEPNIAQFFGNQAPNPTQYARLLCRAYARIKQVDPSALVISAGLAPVGRTPTTIWNVAMDDRVFTQRLFDAMLAEFPATFPCFDAFGFHPQGFPYPPEIEASQLPPDDNGNDFRFRMTEHYHDIMTGYGIGDKPIWLTEFGYLRDPADDPWDGAPPYATYGDFCLNPTKPAPPWKWMRVSEAQQADYLVRAFQYADANMPWIGAMFVFNVDWNNQGWECNTVKFFSIYKAVTGPGDTDLRSNVESLAMQALAAMPKRSAFTGPVLTVQPESLTFMTQLISPTVQTQTLRLTNLHAASSTITWTITISNPGPLTPSVSPLTGTNDATITVQIDPSPIAVTGTYPIELLITAEPTDTVGVPITIPVNVIAVERFPRIMLPLIALNYVAPAPVVTRTLNFGLAHISAPEWSAGEERYQRAAGLDAQINRWPMYWPNIEHNAVTQPRVYDWAAQDANIVKDVQHNLTSLPILMFTPAGLDTAGNRAVAWPRLGGSTAPRSALRPDQVSSVASPPQGLSNPIFNDGTDLPGAGKAINPDNRWAHFVYSAVSRYKPGGTLALQQGWGAVQGIRNWEIWNEPDLDQFFVGSAADYARLLKVAYFAGKFADPQANIIFGGMVHWQKPNWFSDVLSLIGADPQAAANHYFMDDVASHNYAWAWQTFGYMYQVRTKLNSRGLQSVGLWLTETGLPVCGDAPGPSCSDVVNSQYRGSMTEQADFLIQSAAWAAWLKAEQYIWFQLYDDCGNGCGGIDAFGLVRNDNTSRPAYDTYRMINNQLHNVEPYWRERRTLTATNWITGHQEILAFKHTATHERVVLMWTRYALTDTVVLTATHTSATLIYPDGTQQLITPTNGVYTIDLPAATNFNTSTNDGNPSNAGTAAIGGPPRILVEYDPNAQ